MAEKKGAKPQKQNANKKYGDARAQERFVSNGKGLTIKFPDGKQVKT